MSIDIIKNELKKIENEMSIFCICNMIYLFFLLFFSCFLLASIVSMKILNPFLSFFMIIGYIFSVVYIVFKNFNEMENNYSINNMNDLNEIKVKTTNVKRFMKKYFFNVGIYWLVMSIGLYVVAKQIDAEKIFEYSIIIIGLFCMHLLSYGKYKISTKNLYSEIDKVNV